MSSVYLISDIVFGIRDFGWSTGDGEIRKDCEVRRAGSQKDLISQLSTRSQHSACQVVVFTGKNHRKDIRMR